MASCEDAVADVADGDVILVSGFGEPGTPTKLLQALSRRTLKNLTIVSNSAGGRFGLDALLGAGSVSKVICSYPRSRDAHLLRVMFAERLLEVEVLPQGTLSERLRAAGAGLGGFYTPTGVGTTLESGKEIREIEGRRYMLEYPLYGDVALIGAYRADQWGNVTYCGCGRNFGPTMATAARTTIVEVEQWTGDAALPPEEVVTPGIFVDRVVLR